MDSGAPQKNRRVRVRVKICGITNPADALDAIDAGADALGFNGYAGSKRKLDLKQAAAWIGQLPPFVTRVAVLVNPSFEEAETVFALPGIDLLQFHGNETPDFCMRFWPRLFIKAFPAKNEACLEQAEAFGTRAVLLDTFVPGAFGGTGRLVNLELAASFVQAHPQMKVILSGGLTPANVGEAIRAVRPYAVDVASGVESQPGKKEKSLMREFVAAANEAAGI